MRIKLRNVKRGQTVERSFQAGEKWPRAILEKRPVQYLYRDGSDFHFMESESYEQFHLTAEQLGDVTRLPGGRHEPRPHELPGRDHRRGAADLGGPARDADGAGLRGRHAERGAQARHPRVRAGRPGAHLRQRG